MEARGFSAGLRTRWSRSITGLVLKLLGAAAVRMATYRAEVDHPSRARDREPCDQLGDAIAGTAMTSASIGSVPFGSTGT
jgi:hypothetical protein